MCLPYFLLAFLCGCNSPQSVLRGVQERTVSDWMWCRFAMVPGEEEMITRAFSYAISSSNPSADFATPDVLNPRRQATAAAAGTPADMTTPIGSPSWSTSCWGSSGLSWGSERSWLTTTSPSGCPR